jgi:hypothetical protein
MAVEGGPEMKDSPKETVAEPKYCPIMTAGNVSASQWSPTQTRVQCMGKRCGIWSEGYRECGLITPR